MLSRDDTCKALGEKIALVLFLGWLKDQRTDWDKLPEVAAKLARSRLKLCVIWDPTKAHRDLVEAAAKKHAVYLIEESGMK